MRSEWPAWANDDDLGTYYETEWGQPVGGEQPMFERLSLEVFQSGLSWKTILKRRDVLRAAFHQFDPEKVAAMTGDEVDKLLNDPAMIRNRRKIVSTITNANATLAIRDVPSPWDSIDAGLPALIWSYRPDQHTSPTGSPPPHSPESAALAAELKRRGFVHVGPTNVYAMMQAVGVVNDHPQGTCLQRATDAAVSLFLGS